MAHLANGRTTDLADAPLAIPASEYTDPSRFEAERQKIFGSLPLLACLSGDVAEPGDKFIFDAVGPSILIMRGKDRKVRAFLNMCTHRGARLVATCERRKLVVCPFHAWSFNLEGKLVRIPKKDCFDEGGRISRDLISVPIGEWGGMIFVKAHAGEEEIDIEEWLGDLGPQLLALDLGRAKPVICQQVDTAANWKYCLDTFGEAYHFKVLHATTIAQMSVPDVAIFDAFGPHHRVCFTDNHYKDCVGQPEAKWPEVPYTGSHLIFPNTILYPAAHQGGVGMYRLFPGESVGKCFTHMSVYRTSDAAETVTDQSLIEGHNWNVEIVAGEDYSVSESGQRNLEHAPKDFELILGRNEIALQNMHRHIDAIVGPSER
ncbi:MULTISPECIES: SRPBCC family protein [Sphingobium]|uniref:SRPBCC family protein n=1 Tax=Sphingobium TaxID=165695 RepID=UPI00159C02F4